MNKAENVQKSLESAKLMEELRAVVTINDAAEKEARSIGESGNGPIPIVLKDNIDTASIRTTMASRLFINRVPHEDADVVRRLKNAGYVVIGKTNLHEFASGVTTTSSIFGYTRNPLDQERIAGGSSGGSAAAVAAGITEVALGTDTAGSVRIPASLTGTIGYVPTHNLISPSGVFPLAPSFDDVGIISSKFASLEKLAGVLHRRDLHRNGIELDKARFGVITNGFFDSGSVEKDFNNLLTSLEVSEINFPCDPVRVVEAFKTIRLSEALSVHLENRDRWNEYFPDVRRMLESALPYKATDYIHARSVSEKVKEEAVRMFKNIDVLISPTTPIPAPRIEDVIGKEDGEVRSQLSHNTMFAPFADLPAISIPMFSVGDFPVGLQLIGKPDDDFTLIHLAKQILERK